MGALSSMEKKKLFKVVVTAIVVHEGKFLVTQRSPNEKKFPSCWTVPGGKLSTDDYVNAPKDTPDYWYNVLENALRREVKEEAGIEITNIRYVTSLADAREGDDPSLVISCLADAVSADVKLDDSMIDYRWVSLAEAKDVELLPGIYEELAMAQHSLEGGAIGTWVKS